MIQFRQEDQLPWGKVQVVMKVLIDTTLPDLFLLAVKDQQTVASIHVKNLLKKADELPSAFGSLLKKANIKTTDIKEFYITTGPGSFMGSRTAIVFVKTLCLMTKAKLYHASTFALVAGNQNGNYFIDARGNQFYKAKVKNGKMTISVEKEGVVSAIDYQKITSQPNEYLDLFEAVKDILMLEPIYLKDPRIGGE